MRREFGLASSDRAGVSLFLHAPSILETATVFQIDGNRGPVHGTYELPKRETAMRCLNCQEPLPELPDVDKSKPVSANSGHFACPHCKANHVRREVGRLPSGEPLYSVRLWGHLTAARRKSDSSRLPEGPSGGL